MSNKLNNIKWSGYPIGDFDTAIIVYLNKVWKVLPLSIFDKYNIIKDGGICIVFDSKTQSYIAINEDIKYDKKLEKFVDQTGLVIDILSLKKEDINLIVNPTYLCTVNDCIKNFTDAVYMKYDNFHDKSSFCNTKYDYGVFYSSKTLNKTGERQQNQIIVTGTFEQIIIWLNKFSSAASEKNTIIFPTQKKSWLKKYPKSKVIELTK